MTGAQDDPTGKDKNEEDAAVWRRLTQGVKAYEREIPPGARPSPAKLKSAKKPVKPSAGPVPRLAASSQAAPAAGPVDLRRGDHAGIDRSTRRRLSQGQLAIEGRLDLHGMTAAQAERHLSGFINNAIAAEKRCVLVITGKGANNRGVLKRLVPMWLTSPPLAAKVLALSQATPSDGGDGALYVMLRRRRQAKQ